MAGARRGRGRGRGGAACWDGARVCVHAGGLWAAACAPPTPRRERRCCPAAPLITARLLCRPPAHPPARTSPHPPTHTPCCPHPHPQGLLELVHELIERLEAHLVAESFYSVIANMRGGSAEEVSGRLLDSELLGGLQVRGAAGRGLRSGLVPRRRLLRGGHCAARAPCDALGTLPACAHARHVSTAPSLHPCTLPRRPCSPAPPRPACAQGPTVSPVYTRSESGGGGVHAEHGFYAAVICVAKKQLYPAVKEIRRVRGGA